MPYDFFRGEKEGIRHKEQIFTPGTDGFCGVWFGYQTLETNKMMIVSMERVLFFRHHCLLPIDSGLAVRMASAGNSQANARGRVRILTALLKAGACAEGKALSGSHRK